MSGIYSKEKTIEQSFGAMKKRREGMPIETTVEDLIMSYSY